MQVAKGQLEKPLETPTLKFDIGDNTFAEHSVVKQEVTGPIVGLQNMRNKSVVKNMTHGLIHFPQLIMQVKTTSSETNAKLQTSFTDDVLAKPTLTTKTITAYVDQPWKTLSTVTPLANFTETVSLLISDSM